ncbi:MAG: acetolactate decarboxylase [Salinibacter sp.]
MPINQSTRTRRVLVLGLLAGLLAVGCTEPTSRPSATEDRRGEVIYQVATLNSLLGGQFEGTDTAGDLTRHGTLGLGTVDRLDGEMIIVDGTAYAVRNDGTTEEVGAETGIPFGVVTRFDPDTTLTLTQVESFADFQSQLDEALPPGTPLYAFKVTGQFDSLQTRSVPAQEPPYPALKEVIANQNTFTFNDAEGTMVGFYIPDVFEGVNAVGHHAHFVTARRNGGGHVLDVRSSMLTVRIDRASSLRVNPRGPDAE